MTSPFIIIDEIESALSAVETKIDTIDGIVDTINSRLTATRATYIDNIRSYTLTNNTASKTGVLSQKLAYLISLLENSTYGLNALKNASSSNSDYALKPSSDTLITLINSEKYVTFNNDYSTTGTLGKPALVVNAAGLVKVKASFKSGTIGRNVVLHVNVRTPYYYQSAGQTYHDIEVYDYENSSTSYVSVETNNISVFPGDMIFINFGFGSTNTTAYINSLTVCATPIKCSNGVADISY